MSPCRTTMSRPSRHLWTTGLAAALVTLCLVLPVRTSAQSPPDLVVGGVSLTPSVARAGDTVTALVTVRNAGRGPADPSTVDLYLARAANASPDSATALGTLTVDALAPGASIQLPLSFTVPALPRGYVYVIAQADAPGRLAEAYESNNRAARVLEVTSPDVVVSALSLSTRVARAGDTVNAAVTVRNIGRVPADASRVGLFLVGTAGPLEGGTELGVQPLDPLAPGASVQISLSFTVPAVTPASFYVLARADVTGALTETSKVNNRRTAFLQVALPDLVVDSLSVGPSTTRAGDAVTVRVRVRNRGPVPAEASEGAVYFVTSPASALEGATPLLVFPVTRLMPGTSAEATLSLPVPSATAGAYSVVARADSTGLVVEGSESNNLRGAGLRVATPNLVIAGFTASPGTVGVGETLRGVLSLQNRSLVGSYPTTATLYLATDPNADLAVATYVTTIPVPTVPAARAVTLSAPVVVPPLPEGNQYLIVQVDAGPSISSAMTMLASVDPPCPADPGTTERRTVQGESSRSHRLRALAGLDSTASRLYDDSRAHRPERGLRTQRLEPVGSPDRRLRQPRNGRTRYHPDRLHARSGARSVEQSYDHGLRSAPGFRAVLPDRQGGLGRRDRRGRRGEQRSQRAGHGRVRHGSPCLPMWTRHKWTCRGAGTRTTSSHGGAGWRRACPGDP